MADDAIDVDPSSDVDPKLCTPDDLIELVRAVKFAHRDMSLRNVHNEISVTMANSDSSYAFLRDVKLNDVKKIWKRALKSSSQRGATTKQAGNEPIVPAEAEGVIKFYTIGDGSVKSLVDSYETHYAEAAAKSNQQQDSIMEEEKANYTHFFLDVPADLSGSRPHQALINFQDNTKADKGKNKAKKRDKAPTSNYGKEIFKIQLAALPAGMEDVLTPMLLYNSNRTAKTFIHPPSSPNDEDDDEGYSMIRKLITSSGTIGALGATGGQKAYFYGFITTTNSELDVVSIDICSGLAPAQTW